MKSFSKNNSISKGQWIVFGMNFIPETCSRKKKFVQKKLCILKDVKTKNVIKIFDSFLASC